MEMDDGAILRFLFIFRSLLRFCFLYLYRVKLVMLQFKTAIHVLITYIFQYDGSNHAYSDGFSGK